MLLLSAFHARSFYSRGHAHGVLVEIRNVNTVTQLYPCAIPVRLVREDHGLELVVGEVLHPNLLDPSRALERGVEHLLTVRGPRVG